MNDIGKVLIPIWGKEDMNVVGHDHERIELIAFVVEVEKRVGDDFRNYGILKEAGAVSTIKPVVNGLAEAFVILVLKFS
ncbi:MAG: hypothetical protein AAGC74_00055 [Verrucomicrobiota bacterium]